MHDWQMSNSALAGPCHAAESANTDHLWFAEGLLDLGLNICCTVLHEDGAVGVAFRHLFLTLHTTCCYEAAYAI